MNKRPKKKKCKTSSLQRIKKYEEKRAHEKCFVVKNSAEYHFSANTTLKNPDMCGEKVELIGSTL